MRPTFVFSVHTTVGGAQYVSDGALLVRADLVTPSPDPAGTRGTPPAQVASWLAASVPGGAGARSTRLSELVASRMTEAVWRTPDDVAIGARYVDILHAIGRPVVLLTTGATSPIVVHDGATAIGVLMPVRLAPELGTHLAPPSPGAQRARIASFVPAQGYATALLADGREVIVDVSTMVGALARETSAHSLLDLDAAVGRDGRWHARLAWAAGTERPVAPPPRPRPAPLPRCSTSEAFAAVQGMGLLGEFDGGTWARHVVQVFGPEALERGLTEDHVHEILLRARSEDRDREHTQGHAARLEGIFLARELHEDEPEQVLASVRALAERYGVRDVEIEDPLDLDSVFEGLGRAFARSGARERVYEVGRSRSFLLVRESLREIGILAPVRAFETREGEGGARPRAVAAVDPATRHAELPCPICAWPVPPRAGFCPACRVGVAAAGDRLDARAPDLQRGATLVEWDFRSSPPPGYSARAMRWPRGPGEPQDGYEPHPDGILFETFAAQTATLRAPMVRLRRGCVRLTFTALTQDRRHAAPAAR